MVAGRRRQFYALWPLTLFLVGRRKAFWVAGAVVLLVPFIRIAQSHYFPSHRLGIMEEFHTIADCIATGCLLAGLRGWMWEHASYRRFLTSWVVAPAAIFATVALNRFTLFKWLIAIPVFNFSIAICIDRWTRFAHEDYFARFLNLKPVAYVGVLSYSLYLWQQPFLNRYAHYAWTTFPLNLAIAVSLALASYYIAPRPVLSLRYRSSGQKRSSSPVEVLEPVAKGDSFPGVRLTRLDSAAPRDVHVSKPSAVCDDAILHVAAEMPSIVFTSRVNARLTLLHAMERSLKLRDRRQRL